MSRDPASVLGTAAFRRSPDESRVRPLCRGFRGLTLSGRHGGQVTWETVPDPNPT
jgi:hypothetical protein